NEIVGAPATIAEPDASTEASPTMTWFDVGGLGGLRLGVARELGEQLRAVVRVLATFAGLALEAAALRGDTPPAAAPPPPDVPGFVAASPVMKRLLVDIGRLAASTATVVITGESGVGKELIARALHDRSSRADRPYIAFNCAAVPHELF